MLGIVGDLLLRVRGDAAEARQELKETGAAAKEAGETVESAGRKGKAGLEQLLSPTNILRGAILGAGIAASKLAQQVIPLNQSLDRTAATSGLSSDALRKLALSLAQVDRPLEDVLAGFELLTQRGIKSEAQMERLIPIFDTMADALGIDIPTAIEKSERVLGMFGLTLEDMDERTAGVLFALEKMTKDGLGPLDRLASRFGPELRDMNVDFETLATIMLALDRNTGSARESQAFFADAMKKAEGDAGRLIREIEALTGDLGRYADELGRGNEVMEEHAAINTRNLSLWDEIKHRWKTMLFAQGELVEKMKDYGMISAGLVPLLGPLQAGLTKVAAAMTSTGTATHFALGPIGWAVLAVAALTAGFLALRHAMGAVDREAARVGEEVAAETRRAYEAQRDAQLKALRQQRETEERAHRERLNEAQKEHTARRKLAEQTYLAMVDANRRELDEARRVHDEKRKLLDAEYLAKLKNLDGMTAAAVAYFQGEIDAIDDAIRAEDRARKDQEDEAKLASLRALLEAEEGADAKAALVQQLADLEVSIQQRKLAESREDQKRALREELEGWRDRAAEQKEILLGQQAAERAALDDGLAATVARLESEKILLGEAHAENLIRMEEGLAAFKAAEEEKTLALRHELAEQEQAIQAFWNWRLGLAKELAPEARPLAEELLGLLPGADVIRPPTPEELGAQAALEAAARLRAEQFERATIKRFELPTRAIRSFQGGGVVPGPLGAPRIILAHGGERILSARDAAASPREITVNIYQTISDRPTAEFAADEVVRRLRTLGVAR